MIAALLLLLLTSLQDKITPASPLTRVAAGTSSLEGRIFADTEQQQPVAGGRVFLRSRRSGALLVTLTDPEGRYVFEGVADGLYELGVERAGFVTFPSFAQTLATEKQPYRVTLVPGQRQKLDVTLSRGGAIRGQVTDETGAPLESASVMLHAAPDRDPLRPSTPSRASKAGEFAFDGVVPGAYYVSASWRGGAPVFYPGVGATKDASMLSVGAGDELNGINFIVSATTARLLQGKVAAIAGARPDLRLVSSPPKIVRKAVMRDDGSFTFTGLERGRYVLSAVDAEHNLAGWQIIEFGPSDAPIEVTLGSMGSLRGQVVADKADVRLDLMHVGAALTDGKLDVDPLLPDKAEVEANGRFEFSALFGPRTLRLLNVPSGCSLKEIKRGRATVDPPHVVLAGGELVTDVVITLGCQ